MAQLTNDDSPSARGLLYRHIHNQDFIDRLFALTLKDKTSPESLPLIMPFEPETSFYVIKDLTRLPPTKEEYEMEKIVSAYREETIQSQVLAFTHYAPENIFKRMKFKWAGSEKQPDTNDVSNEPNGVLL